MNGEKKIHRNKMCELIICNRTDRDELSSTKKIKTKSAFAVTRTQKKKKKWCWLADRAMRPNVIFRFWNLSLIVFFVRFWRLDRLQIFWWNIRFLFRFSFKSLKCVRKMHTNRHTSVSDRVLHTYTFQTGWRRPHICKTSAQRIRYLFSETTSAHNKYIIIFVLAGGICKLHSNHTHMADTHVYNTTWRYAMIFHNQFRFNGNNVSISTFSLEILSRNRRHRPPPIISNRVHHQTIWRTSLFAVDKINEKANRKCLTTRVVNVASFNSRMTNNSVSFVFSFLLFICILVLTCNMPNNN